MQIAMGMPEFLKEIERRENEKSDFIVRPHGMMMSADDSHMFMDGKDKGYGIIENAHEQIANKLGIPKRYYDAMERLPGLRAYNVNAWLKADDRSHMIRTLDGNVRAMLSDRFKPFDNFLIMRAILPVIDKMKDIRVVASALTDNSMYLQIVFPRIAAEVKVGDVVQAGIIITNSEVGRGSLDVQKVVWVLACGNGMIGSSIMRKYHVGRRVGDDEEDYDIYKDDTIKAELESLKLRLRDLTAHALTMDAFMKDVRVMQDAAEDRITAEKDAVLVENVTKRFGLSEDYREGILQSLWVNRGKTRWDVANAVTAQAHEVTNADVQYKMESAGFALVNLSHKEWVNLNEKE